MTMVSGVAQSAPSGPASVSNNGAAPAMGLDLKAALQRMVREGASDLHLKVGRPPTLRLHGDLVPLDMPPMRPEELRALAEHLLPPAQLREFVEVREADFAINVPGIGRFRVNVYQQKGTVAFAMRAIAHAASNIRDLNLPPVLEQIALKPRGLVLVTGVTGSGKSTALAAMVQHINERRSANIITIEDPIEFFHYHKKSTVNQREVGVDVPSFSEAIRRALRQDPDVILVGEMRDLETIEAAITAAETGHVVFGTLHTNSAQGTVNRIIDAFPGNLQDQIRTQLSTALLGVLAQTLLPKIGGGRVAAYETLIVTPAVANLIRENKTFRINSAIQTGSKFGMQLMDDSLFNHWIERNVTMEDCLGKAQDPDSLARRIANARRMMDEGQVPQ